MGYFSEGTNLVLSYAQGKDSGSYVCEVETRDKTVHVWIEHQLLVETPPVVFSSHSTVTIR
jgi:hypothetical protein